MEHSPTNALYYGDCLTIMKDMQLGSVDLIYLDPPFNSNRDYNAVYKDETGRPLPDQIEAFGDTWRLDEERERSLRDMLITMRDSGLDDDAAQSWVLSMKALRQTNPALLAYLIYMTERLLPMKGILKSTGSIYLHCDSTASHYIKVMMDAIFGHENFRNEIIWHYTGGGRSKRYFSRKHDNIFWYSKTSKYVFNVDAMRVPYKETSGYAKSGITSKAGKKYMPHPDGTPVDDTWDIPIVNPMSEERIGYATQKPLKLLDRIIKASSNEGDVVLDPFCGCAPTIEAAHNLGRQWIGIDIAIHAIKRVSKTRLKDRLGLVEGRDYFIEGVPHTIEGALELWERGQDHFQQWAVGHVDGFVTNKKTADGGIDGRIYFTMSDTDKELSSMVLEVKGGKNVGIDSIRDLRGVLEREGEAVKMAGLIILRPLSQLKEDNFRREMAQAGDLDLNGVKYSRMQMLTIDDILAGKRFNTPSKV